MNEVLTLWAVLLAIYFLECFSLVPEEKFVFRVRWLRRWHPGKSLLRLERRQTRIYLSNFFPGLADIAVCAAGAQPDQGEEQDFRRMLDTKAVRRRVRGYRRVLRPLYWDSWLLFAIIVFFFPVIALRFGLWIAFSLAPAFLLGAVHMVFAFRRVHRALAPDAVSERREKTVGLLLSPLGTIRVPSLLVCNLTAGFHPLAVAVATMPAAEARQVASRILRQSRFVPPDPANSGLQATSEAWRAAVWGWAAREFGDPELLLVPPAKRYQESISFCPRCEQEYLLASGECSDCPGISLETFPSSTARVPVRSRRRPRRK